MSYAVKPLVLTIAAVLASPAWAQEAPIEEVVVTSSRIPVPLRQIGTSVSVLTETEIAAHGNLGLTDVLRQMPGIAVSGNGGAGKATTLRIRGEEGFRTLTIMDGIRLSDPASPQIAPLLEHQMSSGIGRVEVLRGPQGLSYGADAGGVLNISSRQVGKGVSANLDAQAGRYGTQQYSANLGGANERADFFVSAADFKTDGFNTLVDDNVLADNDGYANTTVHARAGVNLNDEWRAEFVHREVDGDAQLDGCFLTSTVHDCHDTYAMQASRGALQYQSQAFSHSLSYATTDTDRDSYASGVSTFDTHGEIERWEYVGSARDLPGFDLVFGSDLERAGFNGGQRDNVGYYLEYLSDFSDSLFLTAGARYDDNDDFGTNTSYRVSGAYLFELRGGGTLKFKSSYGTGFRAPSPYEIAYNLGAFAYPPASLVTLQQEKSRGAEAGVEYFTGNGLHLDAVYFDQRVEDAIFFDLETFSGYLQDFGSSRSRGVELSGRVSLSDAFDLNANYTYNDTERPNGLPRQRRPEQLANLGLSWHGLNDKLSANAFYRVSRNSYDGSGAVMTRLDNFEVLDLSVNYVLTDNITVYSRVENALDERYQEVLGYNTAGAAAYVGIRLNMSE
jgi:vitamin B12 transporter